MLNRKISNYIFYLIKYKNEYKVKEIELNTESERIDRNTKELMTLNKQIVKLNADSVNITDSCKHSSVSFFGWLIARTLIGHP